MGAHDSAFLRDSATGFATAGNQFYNATVALSAGIRLLQAQVHNENGTLQLCHTSCALLNGGTLEAWLAAVKTWMDANPNEVVTLLLVNSDNVAASAFGAAFSASGISSYGYAPASSTGPLTTWPSLQTLISANTRLVTFVASITPDSAFPYLLTEFDFVFETAFGVTALADFNCTLSRPSSLSSAPAARAAGYLGLVNHFKDTDAGFGIQVPDVGNLTTVNSPLTNATGALGLAGQQCAEDWGATPNFLLVDFWNVGPSVQTADRLNGIVATGRTAVSADELSASANGGGRGRGVGSCGRSAGVALGVVAMTSFVWL
jgi:hypothetical protein